ncbi:hypothetical protein T440DRAFT_558737 [Plenodomus tracheiphilus IPT5]|uniref:Uncharacterized protein n=1 Tax=Plenodomus tracheiphilus IPT5 TaxID=1408161 RepID=A0A6A7AQS6_9PLEO|nr:hypothetical protein T440DRAFT_558737 [Plenodomus tracheiphilus IPT5]
MATSAPPSPSSMTSSPPPTAPQLSSLTVRPVRTDSMPSTPVQTPLHNTNEHTFSHHHPFAPTPDATTQPPPSPHTSPQQLHPISPTLRTPTSPSPSKNLTPISPRPLPPSPRAPLARNLFPLPPLPTTSGDAANFPPFPTALPPRPHPTRRGNLISRIFTRRPAHGEDIELGYTTTDTDINTTQSSSSNTYNDSNAATIPTTSLPPTHENHANNSAGYHRYVIQRRVALRFVWVLMLGVVLFMVVALTFQSVRDKGRVGAGSGKEAGEGVGGVVMGLS